jgi:hypothetical protein
VTRTSTGKDCLLTIGIEETYLGDKDKNYLRVISWKRILQANGPKKQAGVAILISNKINCKPKLSKKIRRDTSYSSKIKFTKMNSQF